MLRTEAVCEQHSVVPAPPLVRVYDWHVKKGKGGSSERAGPFLLRRTRAETPWKHVCRGVLKDRDIAGKTVGDDGVFSIIYD